MRRAVIGILLIAVAVIQVSVLAALPLPGAAPDVLLVAVIAAGMVAGRAAGALVGLGAGLLVDIVPPATGPFGTWIILLCGAGVVAGLLGPRLPTRLAMLGGIVALSTAVVVLRCAAAALGSGFSIGAAALAIAATAVYAVLLSPLVVPAVESLTNWSRPPEAA